ncbi:MAG: YCF48-related protein [Candidatus Korobacteraceae bacterium]
MKPSQAHPEPGQLSAFAEQALPQYQRAVVMDHLASCSECRGLLSLILPEIAPQAVPVAAPVRWSFWESLRHAPLRWASAAATAAVVVTAVWVGQLGDSATPLPNETHIFRAEPQPALIAENRAPEATPAPKAAVPPKPAQTFVLDPQAITSASEAPATSLPEQNLDAAAHALRMAAAARSSQMTTTPEAPASLAAQRRPSPQTSSSASVDTSLWATGLVTPTPSTGVGQPLWMISPNGILQRSMDRGATWLDYAMQPGARFKAVATAGDHVWVGGSNAVLYHSPDAGRQWQRVLPVSLQGRAFSGDVVSMEFTSPQHGTVMTTTGDRWVTVDGGRSWRLN